MALTYAQLFTASADDTFRNRVQASLGVACINIAVDSPADALALRRDAFARRILQDPDTWRVRFALPVALGFTAKSNATLTDATDGELDTRVASVFNDLMT